MAFPETQAEMIERGYTRRGRDDGSKSLCGSKNRPGCNQEIEWWETPKGKKIPINPGTAQPHWETCEASDNFRGGSNDRGGNDSGENVSVFHVGPEEKCRFDGDQAVCRVGLGREKYSLCRAHANQLYSLMKAVAKEMGRNTRQDPNGMTSPPPDVEPQPKESTSYEDSIPF